MNVLLLSTGQDFAGINFRIKQAFDRFTGWNVRSLHRAQTYLDYPYDELWSRKVKDLYRDADVVHTTEGFDPIEGLEFHFDHKPTVVHFHGGQFRQSHRGLLADMHRRKATGLVSTIDLALYDDALRWLPSPVVLPMLAGRRQDHFRPSETVRIAHAPTERGIKSTDAFLAACERLSGSYAIEVVLIEQQPWTRCLDLKATADIFFDQVILGYGVNALEAWGMGIPVIAGASEPILDRMRAEIGKLPFYSTTEATIEQSLEALIASPDLRQEWGERGLRYVKKYHDDQKVCQRLQSIYQEAA